MKKITCLLLLSLALHTSAQEFHFIPRAGLNLANTTNTEGSMKPGLNIGMAAEYMVTPTFAAEAGLYYSMQGSKIKAADIDLKHDYLNIPILAKFYVYKGLNIFVGPQVGIKLSVNKLAYGDKEYSGELIADDITRPLDVAAVLGAGYVFPLGLMVSANVNIGMTNKVKSDFKFQTDVTTNREIFTTTDESCKNMVIQFNFGYRF